MEKSGKKVMSVVLWPVLYQCWMTSLAEKRQDGMLSLPLDKDMSCVQFVHVCLFIFFLILEHTEAPWQTAGRGIWWPGCRAGRALCLAVCQGLMSAGGESVSFPSSLMSPSHSWTTALSSSQALHRYCFLSFSLSGQDIDFSFWIVEWVRGGWLLILIYVSYLY